MTDLPLIPADDEAMLRHQARQHLAVVAIVHTEAIAAGLPEHVADRIAVEHYRAIWHPRSDPAVTRAMQKMAAMMEQRIHDEGDAE